MKKSIYDIEPFASGYINAKYDDIEYKIANGMVEYAKHKKILSSTKGMQHYRRRSYRLGKQGVIKALQYSYRDRRNRKRDLRALWITRINNASRELGMSYSQLIAGMKAKNISLDRKVLADLAVNNPEVFKKIVNTVKEK